MDYVLRFAHHGWWLLAIPVGILALVWRITRYKQVQYMYPLVGSIMRAGCATRHPYKKIVNGIRFCILMLLALLLLKPQLVDIHSQVKVSGIDIMLVLDVSGSMQFQDFKDDERARVDIAKDEAVRFINKRDNDAIGLVVFGRDALSRCPLTLDKHILTECVNDLHIGTVNPEGTVLAKSLLTAVNRLKDSQAKSKIIIALTDGEPSEEDIDPKIPIEIAKKLGIKIYTIGIGDESSEQLASSMFGMMLQMRVNKELLTHIATQTGGRFFMARSSRDMRDIYTTIDTLERSELQTPLFSRFVDVGVYGAWIILGLLLVSAVLSTYWWMSV